MNSGVSEGESERVTLGSEEKVSDWDPVSLLENDWVISSDGEYERLVDFSIVSVLVPDKDGESDIVSDRSSVIVTEGDCERDRVYSSLGVSEPVVDFSLVGETETVQLLSGEGDSDEVKVSVEDPVIVAVLLADCSKVSVSVGDPEALSSFVKLSVTLPVSVGSSEKVTVLDRDELCVIESVVSSVGESDPVSVLDRDGESSSLSEPVFSSVRVLVGDTEWVTSLDSDWVTDPVSSSVSVTLAE